MSERELTRAEVFAMWHWGDEYSRQNRSVIEWYRTLSPSRRAITRDFVVAYERARRHAMRSASVAPSEGTANAE